MTLKKLTLPELLKVSCAKFAQRLSLNFVANGKRTYQDLYNEVMAVARHLLRIGVRKGDKVAILSANMPNWGIAQFAIAQTGAVTVPILPGFSATELQNILEHAEVKVIFVSRLLAKQLETVKTPLLKHKILINNFTTIPEGCYEPEELDKLTPDIDLTDTLPIHTEVEEEDIASIIYTSGTTGYPKGVIHDFSYPLAHIPTAKDWQNARDGGLHFTVAETGWAKASWGKIYGQWLVGAAVRAYDFDTFDPRQVASVINRYGVTSFCAPPTVYRYLARKGIPPMPTLEHASTAGEYLSPDIFRLFREKTGLKLHEGYGQTETVLLTADFQGDAAPGSMGRPSPLFDVRILRPDGSEASAGEIGEIAVIPKGVRKAAGIFSDYLGSSQLYSYAWRGGAYHTGDMAWKDGDGIFWFHGRGDDVIKSGGFRIGPGEIEDILSTHPAVMECSVVGVPDEARGQAVKAVVVPAPEAEPGHMLEREIREYCNARLAEYKWIRQVEFRDCLPKTISGKVRKAELR